MSADNHSIQAERVSVSHNGGEYVDIVLPTAATSSEIPDFEGMPVASTRARVVSASNIDVADQVFRMDDTVRMVVEARVEGIGHDVDKDGKLIRIHRMKVLDSIVIDWKMDLETLRDGLK